MCKLRIALLTALERPSKGPEETAKMLREAYAKSGLEPKEWEVMKEVCIWLNKPETEQTRAEPPELRRPEEQAVWGFALLAATKAAKAKPPVTIDGVEQRTYKPWEWRKWVRGCRRLEQELHMMGALLLGTIKDKTTRIGWGSPGSWFYHSPSEQEINMDPGTALLLGLQNSRSICLHEVGHAAISLGESQAIKDLTKKLHGLREKVGEGEFRIPAEKMQEARRLGRELEMRELLWQYTEDAAVNTFAELEGETFPTNIKEAALRCYASTLMSREIAKKASGKSKDLTAMLEALNVTLNLVLTSNEEKSPEEKETQQTLAETLETQKQAEETMKTIESRLKAAAAAYPVSRGWMNRDNPKEWAELGITKSAETEEIVDALAGENGLASVQPGIVASRLSLLTGLAAEMTAKCANERNRRCDEIFDRYILPELEKLPIPPKHPGVTWKVGGGGQHAEGIEEDMPNMTLEQSLKEMEEDKQKDLEDRARTNEIRGEATKRSMGVGSPLDKLPDHCESYDDFLIKCAEPIQHVTRLLKALRSSQTMPGRQQPAFIPEKSLREFDMGAYARVQERLAAGEAPPAKDFRFFKKSLKKEKVNHTRFGFYLDGSGSMNGEETRKSVMTLLIFAEAARKVGGIAVTAVYSGAENTDLILTDTIPTEQEKRVLGSLISTGHARGSNEICPKGLAELSTALRESTPKDKTIGATHYIFLTDGGSCSSAENEIRKGLETLLDGNPNTTFDTVIVDNSAGNPFARVSETTRPKRLGQYPQLAKADSPTKIASVVCSLLSNRIRQIKSFRPISAGNAERSAKRVEKSLLGKERDI